MIEKKKFISILLLASLILALLPFYVSFQNMLTNLIMKVNWYKTLQNVVVPHEMRIVGGIVNLLGFPISIGNSYFSWEIANNKTEAVYLAWNCVGWQTLVLFVVTLISGLSGRHTCVSKLETLAIGILGTYLVNMGRLAIVVIVYYWVSRPLGIIFHDYFSNLLTLTWLFFFWWFSYAYILEGKK